MWTRKTNHRHIPPYEMPGQYNVPERLDYVAKQLLNRFTILVIFNTNWQSAFKISQSSMDRLTVWQLDWHKTDFTYFCICNWIHNMKMYSRCRVHNNGCQLPSTQSILCSPVIAHGSLCWRRTPQEATSTRNNNSQSKGTERYTPLQSANADAYVKVKLSLYRPAQALGFQEVEASRISRKTTHEAGKVISPKQWPPLPPRDTPGTHFY
jgi:hypothetical protein